MDLVGLKERLAGPLLALEGVSGVGVAAESVAIYLERDDELLRASARRVIESLAPGTPVQFIVTGTFRAQ